MTAEVTTKKFFIRLDSYSTDAGWQNGKYLLLNTRIVRSLNGNIAHSRWQNAGREPEFTARNSELSWPHFRAAARPAVVGMINNHLGPSQGFWRHQRLMVKMMGKKFSRHETRNVSNASSATIGTIFRDLISLCRTKDADKATRPGIKRISETSESPVAHE